MNKCRLMLFTGLFIGLLMMTGCTMRMGDSLFALPNLPTEYIQLQNQLESILSSGSEYTTAESGSDRQSVQMIDIDADGEQEVVAFFMTERGAIRAYLFEYGLQGYYQVGYIEGHGRRLKSVSYPHCGDGKTAIALSWSYDSNTNYGLTITGYDGKSMYTMLDTEYTEALFTDPDNDGRDDLYLTCGNTVTGIYRAEKYSIKNNEYALDGSSLMSDNIQGVANIQIGTDRNGSRLLYVDSSVIGGGYITDVFLSDSTLEHISHDNGNSDTWRVSQLYCYDIDGDGIIEVPKGIAGQDSRFTWFEYTADGRKAKHGTYHNISDKWYLFWPAAWGDAVKGERTVRSDSVTTTFYVPNTDIQVGEVRNNLLSLYIISSDGSSEYLQAYPQIKVLRKVGNTVYGYMTPDNDYPQYSLTDKQVDEAFHLIESDLIKGGYVK